MNEAYHQLVKMVNMLFSLKVIEIESKLFLAWFVPRGHSSIVFAVIVLNNDLPGAELIAVIVACTIIFSVFAHGLTASPFAAALAARLKKYPG
jgi:NhaP-type Na+/H+ or K+/H+ antiporter